MPPVPQKPKRKLLDPLKKLLQRKPKLAPHVFDYLPEDVRDPDAPTAPRHEWHNFVHIVGDQTGPDGAKGAYALADGKSGDVTRFPLPEDPNDPKAVFFEEGTAGMMKSMGPDSTLVEITDVGPDGNERRGWWHFRHNNVYQFKAPKDRLHPLQQQTPPVDQADLPRPKPVPPRQDLVEDLYDPKLMTPPKKGSVVVRATCVDKLTSGKVGESNDAKERRRAAGFSSYSDAGEGAGRPARAGLRRGPGAEDGDVGSDGRRSVGEPAQAGGVRVRARPDRRGAARYGPRPDRGLTAGLRSGPSLLVGLTSERVRAALIALGFEEIKGGATQSHYKLRHPMTGAQTSVKRSDPQNPKTLFVSITEQARVPLIDFLDAAKVRVDPEMRRKLEAPDLPTAGPTQDPILTLSGEEFIMNPPAGYDVGMTTRDLAERAPNGMVILNDAFFDLPPEARARALERATRVASTVVTVPRRLRPHSGRVTSRRIMASWRELHRHTMAKVAGKLEDLKARYPHLADDIDLVAHNDPTPQKKYLVWGVKQLWGEGVGRPDRISKAIIDFHAALPRLSNKDINQHTLSQAEQAVMRAPDLSRTKERKRKKEVGARTIARTPEYEVKKILTWDASCLYGANTKWCITEKDRPWYQTYTMQGVEFYFVLGKDGRKYAVAALPGKDRTSYEIYDAEDVIVKPENFPWPEALTAVDADVEHSPLKGEIAQAEHSRDPAELTALAQNGRIQLVVPLLNNPATPDEVIGPMLDKSPFASFDQYEKDDLDIAMERLGDELNEVGTSRFHEWAPEELSGFLRIEIFWIETEHDYGPGPFETFDEAEAEVEDDLDWMATDYSIKSGRVTRVNYAEAQEGTLSLRTLVRNAEDVDAVTSHDTEYVLAYFVREGVNHYSTEYYNYHDVGPFEDSSEAMDAGSTRYADEGFAIFTGEIPVNHQFDDVYMSLDEVIEPALRTKYFIREGTEDEYQPHGGFPVDEDIYDSEDEAREYGVVRHPDGFTIWSAEVSPGQNWDSIHEAPFDHIATVPAQTSQTLTPSIPPTSQVSPSMPSTLPSLPQPKPQPGAQSLPSVTVPSQPSIPPTSTVAPQTPPQPVRQAPPREPSDPNQLTFPNMQRESRVRLGSIVVRPRAMA